MNEEQKLAVPAAVVSKAAATALIDAAIDAAAGIGIDVAVAVVDVGGMLKGFSRMDRAPFLTVEAAIDKAWTGASSGYPTHVWNDYIADPKLAPLSQTARFLPVGGGYPLTVGGGLVGGIGVSGGSYTQDQQIAETALKIVGFETA